MERYRDPLIPLLKQFAELLEGEIELSRLRQRRYEEMAEAFERMAESLKPDSPGPRL